MNLQTGLIVGLAVFLVILLAVRGRSKKSGPPGGGAQP